MTVTAAATAAALDFLLLLLVIGIVVVVIIVCDSGYVSTNRIAVTIPAFAIASSTSILVRLESADFYIEGI